MDGQEGGMNPVAVTIVSPRKEIGQVQIEPFPSRQTAEQLSLSQMTIFYTSKMKEFADGNFKFVENSRELPKQVENTVGKGEIACYEQFLLIPQCFQKTCTANT